MNLQNPITLAGIACASMSMLWFFIGRRQRRGPNAAGRLDTTQVIYLLSLLALLVLAVLTWNDRAISMPLLGCFLGSVVSGLPLLRSAGKEKTDLRTVGDQSPSIRTDEKVIISYSGKPSNVRNVGTGNEITQGNQSPAVETKKDVEIRYEK